MKIFLLFLTLIVGACFANASAQEQENDPAKQAQAGDMKSYDGGVPEEVVVKGGDSSSRISTGKPAIKIELDPFESIKTSLEPDTRFFLSESPLSMRLSRNTPEFLQNKRVIEPWRMSFSDNAGITFYPEKRLNEIFRRGLSEKEIKEIQWTLSITDEEGKTFERYSGKGQPPERVEWSGQNRRKEWIKAGHAYSAVYVFTDGSGAPHTGINNPIQFTGIVHQENSGLYISLDSRVLFGNSKSETEIQEPLGGNLVKSAADLIKRRYFNIPVKIHSYAQTMSLAEQQANLVADKLSSHLMLSNNMITPEGHESSFSEQRLDVVLLNR